jgi:hypothetical protein
VRIGAPKQLCLPTTKVLPTGQSFPAQNPTMHLLCFAVGQTPHQNPVDSDQFGIGPVTVTATITLCLPSNKTVISSP